MNGQTVTKTYNPTTSICVDNNGNYGTAIGTVNFADTDFLGCNITELDVIIRWAKSDGNCPNPTGTGNSYHGETSFRIQGPTGTQVVLVRPEAYSGNASTNLVTTRFNQGSTAVSGTPTSGTFGPNNGNLNNYNNTDPTGTWTLFAGDNEGGDPLVIDYFEVVATSSCDLIESFQGQNNCSTGCGATCNITGDWYNDTDDDLDWAIDNGGTPSGGTGPATDNTLGTSAGKYAYVEASSPCYQPAGKTAYLMSPCIIPGNTSDCHFSFSYHANGTGTMGTLAVDVTTDGTTWTPLWSTTSYSGNSWQKQSADLSAYNDQKIKLRIRRVVGNTWRSDLAIDDLCLYDVVKSTTGLSVSCPTNKTINVNGSCQATLPDYRSQATTSGGCFPTLAQSPAPGTSLALGNTTVTITADDPCPEFTTTNCSFTVTVNDNTNPSISCPSNIVINNSNGVCGAVVTYAIPSGTDNCSGQTTSQTAGLASGATFPIGTTTNTFRVTDSSGNTATCSFTITVNDNENPSISCPANITITGACGPTVVTYTTPSGTDNCPGQTTTQTAGLASGATFPIGTTTNTFVVTDDSGNTNTCSFDVIVQAGTESNDDCTGAIGLALPSSTPGNTTGCATADTAPFCGTSDGTGGGLWYTLTGTGNDITASICGSDYDTKIRVYDSNCGTLTCVTGIDDFCGLQSEVNWCSANGTTYYILVHGFSGSEGNFTLELYETVVNPTISCPANITINNTNGICGAVVTYTTPAGADDCPGQSTTQTTGLASGATFPFGTTTNTFVVTDAAGNTANCSFTVTVNDNEDPNPNCSPYTANLGTGGTVTITTANIDGGSTDNCNIASMSVSPNSFDCSHLGTPQTVTLTVIDDAGNSSTCTSTVTITDTNSECCDISLGSITAIDEGCPGANDGIITITATCTSCTSIQYSIGGAFQAGNSFTGVSPGNYTITIQDSNDNSCNDISSTITTIGAGTDGDDPSIPCPANITINNDAGNCSAVVSWTAPIATDNCGTPSISSSHNSGDTFPEGTTTITYTADDGNGNTATCSFNVTVNDNEDPLIACPANITVDSDNGNCTAVVTYTTPTGTDNCPGQTTAQTAGLASGATFPIGTTTNTFVVNDAAGNTATCSFNVTVNDNEDPLIACPANITVDSDNGNCTAVVTYTTPTGTDNCPGQTTAQTAGLASGATFPIGTTTNTFVVNDAAGNTATCSFNVTVNDNEDPLIACPANITVDSDNGNCTAVVTYTTPTGTDNCPGQTTAQTAGLASGATFPIGTTTNTFVVNDAAGNTATCSFNVTVNDNEDPLIACPANITVDSDNGNCTAVVTYTTPTGTDNCPGQTTAQTAGLASGATFPIGTTTNTFVVNDAAGNTATCSFNVTVNDNEDPLIACPANITVDSDNGNCTAVVTYTTPTGTDNCPGQTTAQTAGLASGATFPIGTTTNTFVVNDAAGNTATCSFNVTVNDNEDPLIACPANITVDSDNGNCTAVVTYTTPTGTDNCPGQTTAQTAGLASGATFPIGTTTNTFVVNDAAGNTATCSFNVTVNDNEDPLIACPANITVDSDNGNCTAVVTYTTPTGTDNCPGQTTAQTAGLASGATFPIGTTTNTFVVNDAAGNTATCSFNVTVNDSEDPLIACPANITVDSDNGNCTAVVTYTTPTGTDNCPGQTTAQTAGLASGATFPIGTTTNTFVVNDAAGNTATCSFNVTVNDNEDPLIACPANITVDSDNGNCTAVVTYTTPTGTDNCPGQTTAQTAGLASGATFPIGTTTNTFVVNDAAGNTATCSFNVTVNDNEDPLIACPANITVDSDNGNCTAVVTYTTPTGTDNCPGQTTAQTAGLASGATFPIGTTTNTFVVNDAAGNTATCSFNVTVNDNEDPLIACPANITVDSDNGNCTAVVTYTTPTGTDNCPGQTTAQTAGLASGATFPIGTTTNTFVVNDAAGNTATCSFNVTVNDNEDPLIACPANITVDSDNGNCTAVVTYTTPTGTDNCPGQTTAQTAGLASGATFPIGTTTNTFVVNDAAGNTATCSFNVTVNDNEDPLIACPANITVDSDNGNCTAVVTYTTPTGTDNCPGQTTAQTAGLASGATFPIGTTTNTFVVNDAAGNTATCSFNVTVNDNEDPLIACPANITVDSDNGNCTAVVTYTTPTGTDNCPGQTTAQTAGLASGATFPIGTTTNTFVVNDAAGNTATCSFNVTVNDSEDPLIACPANITVDSDNGNCTAVVTYTTPTGTDNCPGQTTAQTAGLASGATFPIGTTTNTFVVNDAAGNTATCSFNVTVNDNEDPLIACPANITVDSDNGNCTAVVTYTTPTGTDNCPGQTTAQTAGLASGATFPIGTTTNTFVVNDAAGNTATCSFNVTVNDNEDPLIACPANITVDSDNGNCTAVVTYTTPTGTDNCPGQTTAQTAGLASGATFPIGTTTNTFVVNDAAGNTATCSFNVTVNDNEDPLIACPANITVDSDNGNCTAVVTYTTPTGTDNCPGQTTAQTAGLASGATFPIGTTTNTFVVNDAAGNTATCSFNVTVNDSEDPLIACPANITVDSDNGNCTAVVTYTTPTGTDNCPGQTTAQTAGLASGATFPIGTTTNTFVVNDAAGNTATCSFNVTVNDNEDPLIACPANITVDSDNGNCTAVVTYTTPTGTDNCPGQTTAQTAGLVSGATFPIGTTTNTFVVTDAAGNTATCSFNVTVNDNEDPLIACLSNITVSNDAGLCTAVITYTPPTGTDNCPASNTVLDSGLGSGATFPIGISTETYLVTDAAGNTATCSFTVTINDAEPPICAAQNTTIFLDNAGNASISTGDIDNGSNDNCGVASLALSQTDFDCSHVGANTVTLTVTDLSGNTSDCTATVTVVDNTNPSASCQNITVQLDATGNVSITANDIGSGSTDNCTIDNMSLNVTDFTCAQIGNNTVTLMVTDVNGNSSTCIGTVTVEDILAPTISCPENISANTDAGQCYATVTYTTPVGVDNCSSSTTIQTAGLPSGSTFPVGTTTNTFVVTDVAGLTATCSFDVIITDIEPPIVNCQDATIVLDASGLGSISNSSQVTTSFSDACGFGTLTYSQSAFDCSHAGTTIAVTVTATDINGNTASCVSNVTIVDNVNPTAVCQNITVQLDASGSVTVAPADVDGGSTDNCSAPLIFALSQTTFGCGDVGGNVVTLTVTDAAGNTDTCPATITVEDNVPPVATCQNITVQLNASGTANIVAGDVDGGSSDACGTPNLSIDINSFTCANIGLNVVTLTATDAQGNMDDCTATVTIEDNIPPTAVCQNITIQLDALGDATIDATDINNGSNDACGVISVAINQTAFDCSHIGVNNVILTVTDNNGNVSTCTATVTVEDDVVPVAICQNITIQLDATGNASITPTQVDNGSNDACGAPSLSLDISSFTCANVGANNVLLTATDGSGNTATCTTIVTVEDNIAPVATCQNITVQLDATGNATITEDAVNNGSTDPCGGLSYDTDITSFDCNNLGANTVTLIVTDDNGNITTCTATVTIEDNVPPVVICQNITIQLDASGNASIAEDAVNNGSTDACNNLTFDTDINNFNCTNVGANNVVLTVTDASGNTATCAAIVTVEDNTIPTALCQDITIQLDASGNASIAENAVNNGSTDACGGLTFDTDVTAFDCDDVGTNTVVLTVTDGNGNPATCSATVTVEDNALPTALCQNVTVQLDVSGAASITTADIDNGSNDNCGNVSLALDITSFTCANVGVNTVTLTATDDNGNAATCQATVTVQDNILPTAICQNVTVQLDAAGNASITTTDIDNGSNDNCGIASLALDNSSFTCADVGANTVTLTVTDDNGNVSTCTATVTVQDTELPTAICQDITIQLDAAGAASITTADIDNGSNDNCGIASLALNQTAFDCNDVGANTVTLTVTDNNGNISTCTATVAVQDNIDPSAICQDITVQLDASGNATIIPADVDNGSADNCGTVSLAIDIASFDCNDIGPNTVTLTVTDANMNTFTCQSIATVEDNVDPTAICQDVTIQLDAAGNASITTADIDNGSSDACGIASLDLNITDFDCTDVGANTVSLTVTDNNGNTSICTATVTVQDNINPTAICQNITVQLDAAGNASIGTADIDNGSNDNCSIASLALDNTSFNCSNIGANTVILTVTDDNGNTDNCTATVTIEDNVNPIAVCQDIIVQLDATGNASIAPIDIDNGSSDACSTPTLGLDITTFDCTNTGTNIVTLTVTDADGNTASCTSTVTVQDNINPVLTNCPSNISQLPNTTGCESVVDWILPTISDNCPGFILTSTHNPMDAFPLGTTTVTYTLEDASGNTVTCSFDVEIAGTNAAVDINVIETSGNNSNDGSICDGNVVTLDAGVGYASYTWSTGATSQSITTANAGVYIVTVSNGFGCSASDSETITILEKPIATLTCPDPELNECQGRFNCHPNDSNSTTLPIVIGSFSGTAAPYVIGSDAPGSDTFIDFNNMPKDVELELIYTVTTPDGCSDSTSCTFLVESKKANPGRF